MRGTLPVDAAQCLEAKPSVFGACNRFLCPQLVFSWSGSEWSECVSAAGCGEGNRTRVVACTDWEGTVVGDEHCVGMNKKQPASTMACVACQDGATGGTRQCADGGFLDAENTCCHGAIAADSGRCCGPTEALSSFGACCAGTVDVCGVCGGSGVAIDRDGVCCDTALSASGECCGDAGMDSCGVCGGTNECGAAVCVTVALNASTGAGDDQLSCREDCQWVGSLEWHCVRVRVSVRAQRPRHCCRR